MRLDSGEFQGQLHPPREEVLRALHEGPVIVDTNVLVSLYAQPERPREAALRWLRSLGERLWVPHQVAVEFWRARRVALQELRAEKRAIAPVSEQIDAALRRTTLGGRPDVTGESVRSQISDLTKQIEDLLAAASGSSIDATAALRDTQQDPVLRELIDILGDRVGNRPADFDELVARGLRRFGDLIPPGYKDGGTKKDQVPERGTGDYLVWEETLRYLESLDGDAPFVFVSNDGKEDWRLVAGGTDVGPRPELVAEAVERTGRIAHIIRPPQFYELLAADGSTEDQEAAAELTGVAEGDWAQDSFDDLIQALYDGGYDAQANVILSAAQGEDGFIARDELYEVAGYDESRSLTRFGVPATRIASYLREDENLGPDTDEPLWAVYNGPGKAIGYRVPLVFSQFVESWLDDEMAEADAKAAGSPVSASDG